MKIKNEKVKTVLVLGLMLGLFAAVVLVPYGMRDAGLKKRSDAARSELGIDHVGNSGLVHLYNDVETRREKLSGTGRHIPDKDGISRVIKDFSGLINAQGVTGQEIQTDQAQYYADYNIQPFQIQFSAPFSTAYDLVERIEQLSSVVRVDRLSIESPKDYPQEPLTVYLQLSAFFATEAAGGDL